MFWRKNKTKSSENSAIENSEEVCVNARYFLPPKKLISKEQSEARGRTRYVLLMSLSTEHGVRRHGGLG